MTEHLTKEHVLEALKRVKGPDLRDDIVSLGLVSEVVIHKGKVYFAISVDPARAKELEALRQAAEKAVFEVPGVKGVAVTLTADRAPDAPRNSAGTVEALPYLPHSPGQGPRATHAIAQAVCRVWPISLPSRRAKVASANRPLPSISRSR